MDFTLFEKKYNILIPLQYFFLLKKFDFSNLFVRYYDKKEDFYFRITKWLLFKNEQIEIKIDSFFSELEIFQIWERHINLWGAPIKFLPIASLTFPTHGLLMISIQEDTFGQVWYTKHGERNPEYAEQNLLELLSKVTPEFREDKIELLEKLHKFWGEDFWRIKDQ